MKSIVRSLFLLGFSIQCPIAFSAEDFEIRILGTSDVHGALTGFDYYRNQAGESGGLARLATLVSEQRRKDPQLILVDNGDLLQGNPLCDFLAREKPMGTPHPVVQTLNRMKYDVAGIGNHEFNFGLPKLRAFLKQARFPVIASNVFVADGDKNLANDKPAFRVSAVVNRRLGGHPLRVGFVSSTPVEIMNWDAAHLRGKLTVHDEVAALREAARTVRKRGADVVIALAHTGFEDASSAPDDKVKALAILAAPEVDGAILGHSHLEFPSPKFPHSDRTGMKVENGTVGGKPAVIPGSGASHLGVLTLRLTWDGRWKVVSGSGELLPSLGKEEAAEIVKPLRAVHEEVVRHLERPIGETTVPLNTFVARVADSASLDLVARAQSWFVRRALAGTENGKLPLLSAVAPFRSGNKGVTDFTEIPVGPLTLRHASDLYVYANTVAAVKLSGRQVRDWLETSAGAFNTISPDAKATQSLLSPDFPGFNFDVIEGLDYAIDVTQPVGKRLVSPKFQGKDLSDAQEFIVATNNYRAFGGGKFPHLDGSTVILAIPEEVRQVVADYIRSEKRVTWTADGNWRLKPFTGTGLVVVDLPPQAGELVGGWLRPTGKIQSNGLAQFEVNFPPEGAGR